jgi:acetylornithine deacetylase/succinyl-diaminopimelate desuccinylase-like protein
MDLTNSSTRGSGMFGIPSVGFGPAPEDVAHTVNDRVPIEHLTRCAAMYAAFPGTYLSTPKVTKSKKPTLKAAVAR